MNTTTDDALVWTDPLAGDLHHLRSTAADRRWRQDTRSGDVCSLYTAAPEATPADVDLARGAHTHLTALSRALWALGTDPALAAQATALLGAASPGPWTVQEGSLVGPAHAVADTGLQGIDPGLLAEALAGEPGEPGHNACADDVALLAAAPEVIVRLADAVLAGLDQHGPNLQEALQYYDLQDEEDYEAATELVADIGHWREHPDLLGDLACRCAQVWPCPPRQRAHYHLTGHTP